MGNVDKQTQSSCCDSRSDWQLVSSAPYFVLVTWAKYGIQRMRPLVYCKLHCSVVLSLGESCVLDIAVWVFPLSLPISFDGVLYIY